MSETGLGDLLAAVALMLAAEGLVLALFTGRLPEILARLAELGPDRTRWAGLAMAAVGTGLYALIRG